MGQWGKMGEWADFFFFPETILFLSVPFFLFLVSICDLWDLIDIVLCSLFHPLYQCSLVGQVNLIPGAQSLPIQSPRPTLGKGQDVACAAHTQAWHSAPTTLLGPGREVTPSDTWRAVPSTSCTAGITAHGQGNGTKEITLALQAPRWGKSTSGPKGCNCWGQKVTTH